MLDLQKEDTTGIIVDPFQGKKPTQAFPFDPIKIVSEAEAILNNTENAEKPYRPSHAAMFGMAVDASIHNALTGDEKIILGRYCEYLEKNFGKAFADTFIADTQMAGHQVKEQLLPVIGNRIPFFIRGTPLGSPPKLEEQLYAAMRDPNLHELSRKMGYPTLGTMALEASQHPHDFKFKNGELHVTDLRQLHIQPLPEHILAPEAAEFLINASLLGHHVHIKVNEHGQIEIKDYLKRHTAIPDVFAILIDPHHKEYAKLRAAAEQFTQGIRGSDYFGSKFLGNISSLDAQTIESGSLLVENAILKHGKNVTWLPAVSFLLAEGKTLVNPTFMARFLMDPNIVTDSSLIKTYSPDFGETLNAFEQAFFNIHDTGRKAPADREEDAYNRMRFKDGIYSVQNNYALLLTRMIGLDSRGNLLKTREEPESRVLYVPAHESRKMAEAARAQVA